MLTASSSNHHSLASIDRNGENGQAAPSSGSYDFLPSVSFDDLHTSIESASTEFKLTQFPSPTGEGSILEAKGMADKKLADKPTMTHGMGQPRAGNAPVVNRPGRSGSILRRPSTSSRHTSTSSMVSSSSGTLDAPTAPAAMRNRRQSHYPPVSNATIVSKPPRRSTGSGTVGDADTGTRSSQVRRTSLLNDKGAGDSSRRSIDGTTGTVPDITRNMASSRATKAKSVQPPLRPSQANMLGPGSNQTPEHNRLSTLAPRSPRVGGKGMTPSSGGKRASMMPGSHHSSHATGLGARTISPTDTRRMKRLSTMPHSQSLNMVADVPPPPPVSMDMRADSRSPSMIPRKASGTPSSARTTPDFTNRKSYSSGLSVGSVTSYNTVRTSTGSMQPRLPQSVSTSRLPAPKHTTVHNPVPAEDEEDVPPVPAIPKAYESPKNSPGEAYFVDKKKTSLSAVDALSAYDNSTGSIFVPVHPEPIKVQHRTSARKSSIMPTTSAEHEKNGPQAKKQLQPLRLPPLNIGPLTLPTNTKVAALQDHSNSDRDLSPPPSRQLLKTPTTPMTASKSSFFSKSKYDETIELPSLRSSTSVHHTHHLTPTPPDGDSSDLSIVAPDHKTSISPFLSSSLPKGGFEHSFLKRSKTGGDYPTLTGHVFEERGHQKPAGPREPSITKPMPKSPPPEPAPEEPQTPSTKSSLRRKLSLTWKRGNSKGSITAPSDVSDKSSMHQPGRQDSMPPPRIPASATTNSLSSAKQPVPSPTAGSTGGYLESRRRKSSAASLTNYVSHDRVRSDTWGKKKEAAADSVTLPATRSLGVASRVLKPKTSISALRSSAYSATDLDKEDSAAEEEMRKMGSRRKETEVAARALDALRKRASPKERVSPHDAIRIAMLNIYERGEIIDFDDIYFCGTQNAHKVVGDVQSDVPNFGYDDDRGDYTIIPGDHLAYRYEIVDILGKGSFGQVVRCIDHKQGVLVAIKIIRNKKRFHQQALVEVNILQKLREWVSCFPLATTTCALTFLARTPRTGTAWSALPSTFTSVGISVFLPSSWI